MTERSLEILPSPPTPLTLPADIGNSLLNKPWAKEKPKGEFEIFLTEWKWKCNVEILVEQG